MATNGSATDKGPAVGFNASGVAASILEREFGALDETEKARYKAQEMAERIKAERAQLGAASAAAGDARRVPCPNGDCGGGSDTMKAVTLLLTVAVTVGATYGAYRLFKGAFGGATPAAPARAVARGSATPVDLARAAVINQ